MTLTHDLVLQIKEIEAEVSQRIFRPRCSKKWDTDTPADGQDSKEQGDIISLGTVEG